MKRLLILILAAALVLAFAGCKKSETVGLDEFEQLLSEADSSEETEPPFAERVYVIIPQSCSAELAAKAQLIAEKISEKTEVPASVKYDNEATLSQGNNLEILVGATNRLHSSEVLEPLKVCEYVCCWDRGVIIIGGRYEDSTLDAMDEFIEKVLPGATAVSLMGENVNIKKDVEYEIEKLTVNGYDLYDFTIVYSAENKNSEKDVAMLLRDYLAKQSGYLLDVIPHSERTEHTGKVIAVGDVFEVKDSFEDYGAVIRTLESNDVLLNGKDGYALSVVASEFVSKIFSNLKDKTANADLSKEIKFEAKDTSVKVCTAFVSGAQSAEQIYDITEKIREDGNDLLIFSPTSDYVAKYISFNKCSYEYYSVELNDGTVFCALYKADTVKDLTYDASGAQPKVSFASLADGKNYCVTLYSESENDSYGAADVRDVLVIDSPVSEDSKKIDGFVFVGKQTFDFDGQKYEKNFYIEERFGADGAFESQITKKSDWMNVFCSVKMSDVLCEGYVALTNAVK